MKNGEKPVRWEPTWLAIALASVVACGLLYLAERSAAKKANFLALMNGRPRRSLIRIVVDRGVHGQLVIQDAQSMAYLSARADGDRSELYRVRFGQKGGNTARLHFEDGTWIDVQVFFPINASLENAQWKRSFLWIVCDLEILGDVESYCVPLRPPVPEALATALASLGWEPLERAEPTP